MVEPPPVPETSPRARCAATSEDEHAVSTETLDPLKPKAYDRRPHATDTALPVPGVRDPRFSV
jgi:hypothetical protein